MTCGDDDMSGAVAEAAGQLAAMSPHQGLGLLLQGGGDRRQGRGGRDKKTGDRRQAGAEAHTHKHATFSHSPAETW